MHPLRPKLPKWPFYLGDALLITFGLILYFHGAPTFGVFALWASIFCVILGAALFVIPFVLEHQGGIEILKKSPDPTLEDERNRLKLILTEMLEVNDSFASQVDLSERQVLILESLLKRMEARLRVLDEVSLKTTTASTSSHSEEVFIDFGDEHQALSEQEEALTEAATEPEEQEFDIEFEMDEDLLEDSEEEHTSPEPQSGEQATIIVRTLMGIGSKPYIRGEGPGLSWDQGTPMEFVEIGQWKWTSPPANQPITFQIYKNDEISAQGDTQSVSPGSTSEIHPNFEV